MSLLISMIRLALFKSCGRKRITQKDKVLLFLKEPANSVLNRNRFIHVDRIRTLTAKIYRTFLNNYFEDAFKLRLYVLLDFHF